jgi:hypothetical protein
MPVAHAAGLFQGAQIIMRNAKERAPKDTEDMSKTGYVAAPEISGGGKVTIEAGFGGNSLGGRRQKEVAHYVVRQHYDTSLSHPNGGEAMFFQNACDAHAGDVAREVARAVTAFLRGKPVNLDRAPDIAATPNEGK